MLGRDQETSQGWKQADLQVDETRFTDIGGDEFGCDLDGIEKQGEVACGGSAETHLVLQDMAGGCQQERGGRLGKRTTA